MKGSVKLIRLPANKKFHLKTVPPRRIQVHPGHRKIALVKKQLNFPVRKVPIKLIKAIDPESKSVLGKTMALFFSKRYDLKSELGHGGMGTVYKGWDKLLNTEVAIKLLPPSVLQDTATVERFKNEAKLAMQLSHENIVRLYHFGIEHGRMFLVMEYVEGKTFRQILSEMGSLSLESVLQVTSFCASALDYAHKHGVVHRDLKPENMMLNQDSVLKIIDFGTARRIGRPQLKTDKKFVEGTPAYTSPEQFTGQSPDLRADIYSLGAIVHEMLTGKPVIPFNADPKSVAGTTPEIAVNKLTPPIVTVIRKAIEKDIEVRWPSAGVFYDNLCKAAAQRTQSVLR